MAGKGAKILIGCGAGCGVLILVSALLMTTCALSVKRAFAPIAVAEESYQQVVARFGEIEQYTPPADGAIPEDRMEIFLVVRDALHERQAELDAMFADFPPDHVTSEERVPWVIFGVLGAFAKMIRPISESVDLRHQALLEHEMGLGEYLYIYCTAYYAALGHSPEDGPRITKRHDSHVGGATGDRLFGGDDGTFAPQQLRHRYRRYMLAMLRNQLASLPERDESPAADEWRQTLTGEINRFESRPGSVPWQRGLPPAIEASLAPYRHRLDATYHANTNCFELSPRDEEWSWSD